MELQRLRKLKRRQSKLLNSMMGTAEQLPSPQFLAYRSQNSMHRLGKGHISLCPNQDFWLFSRLYPRDIRIDQHGIIGVINNKSGLRPGNLFYLLFLHIIHLHLFQLPSL